MRLIDADLFLENAKNELNCERKCCECDYYNLCEIYKMVEKQPTAYDVDKAVEKIREYADNVTELGGNFLPQVVIEIVKSGGTNGH